MVAAIKFRRGVTGRQHGCINCYLRRLVVYHLRKPIDLRSEGEKSLLDVFDSPGALSL